MYAILLIIMAINHLIWEYDKGRKPSDLVREGYPKSTVYAAYKRWLRMRTVGLPGLKIFISHSVADLNLVIRLHELLTSTGVIVYVAELQPQPGAVISRKIEEMIRESDYVLVLLTENGRRSPFVNYEVGLAKGLNKSVIPLVQRGLQVSYFQGIDVVYFDKEDPEQTVEWLMDYVRRIRHEKARAAFMSALATLGIVAIVGVGLLGLFSLLASGQKPS